MWLFGLKGDIINNTPLIFFDNFKSHKQTIIIYYSYLKASTGFLRAAI